MPLNNSQRDIKAHRRSWVARLRLEGLTVREIAQRLAELEIVNPETKRPWSLGTVHGDVQALYARWQREAREDIDLQKARLLAEGRQVRRRAWEKDDLVRVQRGIDQEAKILGLDRSQPVSQGGSTEAGRSARSGNSAARATGGLFPGEIDDVESETILDQLGGLGDRGDVAGLDDLARLAAAALQNATGTYRAALIDRYSALLDAGSALADLLKAQVPAPYQEAADQEGAHHVTEQE